MDQKPKARRSPSKTERPKTQSERFIETARTIGVDESGKEFDRRSENLCRHANDVSAALHKRGGFSKHVQKLAWDIAFAGNFL
jgi:hypothetical protein